MKFKYFIVCLLFITLTGCVTNEKSTKKNNSKESEPPVEEEHKETELIPQPAKLFVPTEVDDFIDVSRGTSILHPNPRAARDELNEIAGSVFIIYTSESGDNILIRTKQYLEDGQFPKIITKENDILFSKTADLNTKTNLGILQKVIVGLKTNQKLQFFYETVAKAIVPEKAIPWPVLDDLAKKKYSKRVKELYYVRSLTLNRITYKTYSKLETGQKIKGSAFSIGNEIFQSSSENQFEYEVVMDGIPIFIVFKEAHLQFEVTEDQKDLAGASPELSNTLRLPDLQLSENLQSEEFKVFSKTVANPDLFEGFIKNNPNMENRFLSIPRSLEILPETEFPLELKQLQTDLMLPKELPTDIMY